MSRILTALIVVTIVTLVSAGCSNPAGPSASSDVGNANDVHAQAVKFAGRLSGADPGRSANVRALVRARLAGRRHRVR